MNARQKRLEKAQTRVMLNLPFFARGVAKLERVVWDESVMDGEQPTACTNGLEIRWHPADFDSQSDAGVVTTLCEEVWHCLFNHIPRCPSGADARVWNEACDHALRLAFKEFSAIELAKNRPDPFVFPEPKEAYAPNPAFAGLSEEQIYRELAKRPRMPQGASRGIQTASGSSAGQSGASGKQGEGAKSKPAAKPEPHSMPAFGQFEPALAGSGQSDPKKTAAEWENTLIQSVAGMQQGAVPAGLQRFVDRLVNPGVDWWSVLRSWLREQCADDWDYMTPNQAMDGCGLILPSLRSERCGPVVFATDTSGSINDELLAKFRAEKQSCLDEMRPSSLLDIYCDAKVHLVREYGQGEEIGKEAPGGGGTAFEPVFAEIERREVVPKCLVYLTDLYGSFPQVEPGYPCLWVTWTKDGKAPFGEVIYAE